MLERACIRTSPLSSAVTASAYVPPKSWPTLTSSICWHESLSTLTLKMHSRSLPHLVDLYHSLFAVVPACLHQSSPSPSSSYGCLAKSWSSMYNIGCLAGLFLVYGTITYVIHALSCAVAGKGHESTVELVGDKCGSCRACETRRVTGDVTRP